MSDNYIFMLLSVLFSTVTALMAFVFFLFQRNRNVKYNDEMQRIELDMYRKNIESQYYALNEKYSKDINQWSDSLNMQISANGASPAFGTVKLNSFLRSAGLTEADIELERMVFVLTPFHPKYQEQYDVIKSVCEKSGFRCIRGDEQKFSSDIFPHVLKNIVKARLIIANLTGRNPNVLYELGLAHALDKTTIIVSKLLDDIPVDIKSKKIVTFMDNESLINNLQIELTRSLH